jgi:hypothetical protein
MKLRTIAIIGALGIAAIALIGAGAAAQFATTTTSNQTINAGTLSGLVVLSNPTASGNGTPTITLATPASVGSSFTTGDQPVEMTNNASFAATESTITLQGSAPNDLYDGLNVCVANNEGPLDTVIYNGPLSAINGIAQPYYGGTTIAPGGTDYYYVNIYAGNELTMCDDDGANGASALYGSPYLSHSNPLDAAAAGESQTVSLTVGYTG